MTKFVFTSDAWTQTRRALFADTSRESSALAIAHRGPGRLVVRDVLIPDAGDYAERSSIRAVVRPEFLFDAVGKAKAAGAALVFLHTHPGDGAVPRFSAIDDAGERRLASYLRRSLDYEPHGAIVLSPGGIAARVLATDTPAHVISVGRKVQFLNAVPTSPDGERFDRQIRAFGDEGQAAIGRLRIGIVGLGGTGSLTAQCLAHVGVTDFCLVDFDRVDPTNLNRLVGAGPGDVGQPKIDIALRSITAVNPRARVEAYCGDVSESRIAARLAGCDLLFGCTDSHASRMTLSHIAYQYLVPVIDMGVSISVRGGALSHVTGRVQLLAPGLPCFTCLDLLDAEQIRRELLTPEARAADPYIIGHHEPQPSVISLNATMSSLAVSMFLGVVTNAPMAPVMQIYDGLAGSVRPTIGTVDPSCYVCSFNGALARGDSWPLPSGDRR